MTQSEFSIAVTAAEAISHNSDALAQEFWAGYTRGLRRHIHGDKFGTAEEHKKYLSLAKKSNGDRSRGLMGLGYQCGFSGATIARAITRLDEIMTPTIGEQLRAERARREINQLQAAREIGISLAYLAAIEQGRVPAAKTKSRITAWLNV